MSRSYLFLTILWLLSALCDTSDYCYVWQLKTYLWSRFRDFLSTVQGKKYWLSYRTGIRFSIAISLFILSQSETIASHSWSLIYPFFLADLIYNAIRYRKKQLRFPTLNPVSATIIVLTIGVEAIALYYTRDIRYVLLFIPLRFVIVSLLCGLIEVPRQLMITVNLIRAYRKLAQYPKLTIIGITGSYGKSTTKEFLATILQRKYRVLKTPDNINADVGISKFINSTDFSQTDIVIIEMGAYRRGHIKRVCKYIRPSISILTAINEQHVSLFGSIEHTILAKYEILQALPLQGLAVVNGDIPACVEHLSTLHSTVKTFGVKKENTISYQLQPGAHTSCTDTMNVMLKDTSIVIPLPHAFVPYSMNVLAGIAVADWLKITSADVKDAITHLSLPAHGMKTYSYGLTTIIDDSYSSNSDGFRLALRTLASYPQHRKKIIMTRGMIELGQMHDSIHTAIGREIAQVANEVVIITPDALAPLTAGIREIQTDLPILTLYTPDKLVAYMELLKNTSAVILIENRIPAALKKIIQQDHV